MTFSSIPQYDATTPGNNTDIGGVSVAEGWPAANINNSIRQLLTQLKQYLANSATVASASTVDLGAQTANYITISGTTTITSFGTVAAGTWRLIRFSGALQLTYNATSMILPGAANLTTVAGDMAMFLSEGSGNWRCLLYQRSSVSPAGTTPATNRIDGRLTAISGTPIPASGSDFSISTFFWTPYKGNQISVYNGSSWQVNTFSELSVSPPSTTNTNYDVFYDYNSGTPQLSLTAWSGDNTRATALSLQDGIYVLSGTPTKRYLGTVRTGASTGVIPDTPTQRYIWNYYNRVPRQAFVVDTADNWTYSSASWHQANANTANKIEYVQGISEAYVEADVVAVAQSSTTATLFYVGIGLSSVTANIAQVLHLGLSAAVNSRTTLTAKWKGVSPTVGYNYLAWLEQGAGSGTQTWYGDNGTTISQSGMIASITA